jgi:uncharacterized membrane protein YfcA
MNWSEAGILFLTGIIAGVMNGIVGGGTFLVFPVLLFLGIPPIAANASATVGTFPGTLATMVGYRQELRAQRKKLMYFTLVSFLGGGVGAAALLIISNATFDKLIPFLLLFATLIFTFRDRLVWWLNRNPHTVRETLIYYWVMQGIFLLISIYGGFFGAGMGIMMMALLGVMGVANVNEASALRAWVGLFSNAIAVLVFVWAGLVYWPQVLVLMVGMILGSYSAVRYFRQLPPAMGHRVIMVIAWSMTLYFFLRMILI